MQTLSSNRSPKPSLASLAGRSTHSAALPHILPPNPRPLQNSEAPQLHGEPTRPDPFRWLHAGHRNPRVLQYLQQENEYRKLQLRHIMPLRKQIEDEIAELVWRQAIMMAAQQQPQQTDANTAIFASYTYRKEPLPSGPGVYRHLREPRPQPKRPITPPTRRQQQIPQTKASSQLSMPEIPPPLSYRIPTNSQLSHHQPKRPVDGPQLVLDESQRAAACTSPAAYALHTFAPSPSFSFAAFTETCDPVPQGELRPDRFKLHVIDAVSGQPIMAPLSGVSGEVGWVVAPPPTAKRPQPLRNGRDEQQSASESQAVYERVHHHPGLYGNTEEDQIGSCRMYFTRAAQRELWCVEFSSLNTSSSDTLAALPAQQQQQQQQQPQQPQQVGDDARGEGAAAAAAGTHTLPWLVFQEPYGQPIQLVRYGRHLYAQCLSNTGVPLEVRWLGVASGGPERLAGGGAVVDESAGLALMPRQPGGEYSVLSFSFDALGQGHDVIISGSGDDDAMHDVITGVNEPLLLWLRDVARPNGCLLLASVGGGSVAVTELVAHDPGFRMLHVETHGSDRVMRVSVAVDERGDPMGRYELQELQINWEVVQQQAGASLGMAVGCRQCSEVRGTAAAAGLGFESGCSSGAVQLTVGEIQPPMQAGVDDGGLGCSMQSVNVRRRRSVRVTGSRQHVLRVLAWDETDATVTLSYSSIATPPAATTVRLLPCSRSTYPVDSNAQKQQPMRHYLQRTVDQTMTTDEGSQVAVDTWTHESVGVELLCGGTDPSVITERLWATSHDGAQIPITLCRPLRDVATSEPIAGPSHCGSPDSGGSNADVDERSHSSSSHLSVPVPLLLRVYGAYGRDPPLDYQPSLVPLLRRGVAVATAHVRGGALLGPGWYEGGRGAAKGNSAQDLVAVAAQLVACGVTSRLLMCLEAESAGGWAAGPALNTAGTSLFRAAVLTVPTLDPLTSLLEDPTYGPYELGDPRADPDLYRAVRCWAPYDGVGSCTAANTGGDHCQWQYPALLLRVGLYDTSVPYWDPAKYMARLRSLAAAEGDGGGGMVGSALRVMQLKAGGHEVYDTLPDDATRCAFVLWALGCWPPPAGPVSPSSPVAADGSTARLHTSA